MSEAKRIMEIEEQMGKQENRIRILEERHKANYAFTSGLLLGWVESLKRTDDPSELLRVCHDMMEHSRKLAKLGGLREE